VAEALAHVVDAEQITRAKIAEKFAYAGDLIVPAVSVAAAATHWCSR
jgi:hypothetical protein